MGFPYNALLVCAALCLVIWTTVARITAWRRLRHIKGPIGVGWTGIWMFRRVLAGRLNLHVRTVCEKYGPLARIAPNYVVCSDGAEVRRIWSARAGFHRSVWYKTFRFDPSNDNVITAIDNKHHHRLRSNIIPGYSGRGLDDQEQLVDVQVTKLVQLIERKYVSTRDQMRPFDLVRPLQYLTQDVISVLGFGKAFGCLDEDKDVYGFIEISEATLASMVVLSLFPYLVPIIHSPLMKPFVPKPTDKHGLGRLMGVIKDQVDTRYGTEKTHHRDVLQAFVESQLDRDDVRSEAMVQLIAGTDTTATAIRSCIFFVCSNAAAYRQLQDEIDSASKTITTASVVSYEVVMSMPYLQAVIKESLRMWPPIMGIMARCSDRDEVICGVPVPAGTNITWAPMAYMRDKAVFGDDAETFDPTRWLDADPEKLKIMEMTQGMVFGTGSRWECLGKRIAYMEMGKVIFELFRAYDFTMMTPEHPFSWENWGITIQHDMTAKVTRR